MKPVNRSERNRAFWQFLLFFLVTVAVIVSVVFFSFEVPKKENEQLQQAIRDIQKAKGRTAPFDAAIKAATDELNSYNPAIENPTAKKHKVKRKLDEMYNLLGQLPDGERTLYDLVVQNLTDLNEAKAQLRIQNYR